jgi:hypothetical protein
MELMYMRPEYTPVPESKSRTSVNLDPETRDRLKEMKMDTRQPNYDAAVKKLLDDAGY